MRVLFVISSLDTGGAQRVLSNLVTNLPEDWEIDILLNNTGNISFPYKGNLIDLKIKIPSNRDSFLYLLRVFFRRYITLRRLKKKNTYNACISFLESANIVNVLTGKKHCRTILTVHSTLSRNASSVQRLIFKIIRVFYNRASRVITVSKGVKHDLVCNLGVREDVVNAIWNGFPLERIREQAGQRKRDDGVFTVITMGRCEQPKGQWHLIRAFSQLSEKHSDCRLVILGDGAYMDYLRELVKSYQAESKVLLKGFTDNPFSEAVNADVFVLPSLWEGFGNVIIEAMACDLPIIATDFRSGAREILAPDTDINFEQTSEVELAGYGIITPVCSGIKHSADVPLEPQELLLLEAMELLYKDENLRCKYSEASKKRAQDFSIENAVEQWRELLEG